MNWARVTCYIVASCIIICGAICPCVAANGGGKREEDLGRKYSLEVEKECKLVDDPAILERVQQIGKQIADIANSSEVAAQYGDSQIQIYDYVFKVIEDEDINAFSLPGGRIYVNSGLIKAAGNDDELAGVIAHEVAHSAHHHVMRLIDQQSKIDRYVALIALVGILGNARGSDLNNLLMGANMVRQGKVSGYTLEAERDADKTAAFYMAKSSFNPIGLIEFMKKLELQHQKNPTLPLGIYQTHPSPFRRIASISTALKEAGVTVDMRKLRGIAFAQSVPVTENSDQYQVLICDRVVCRPVTLPSGLSSKDRAEIMAKKINSALDNGIQARDLTQDMRSNSVMANGRELIKLEPADLQSKPNQSEEILRQAKSSLERAAWADWLANTSEAMGSLVSTAD